MCEWACTSGAVHRTLTLISSTEIISYSVHRTIVLVGYGTGTVPGTNGLRYEYDSLYTSEGEPICSSQLRSVPICSSLPHARMIGDATDAQMVGRNDMSGRMRWYQAY